MAELSRVTINELTPGEVEPAEQPATEETAPQVPHNTMTQGELPLETEEQPPHLADSSEEEGQDPEKGGLEIRSDDRPEWLPEKFNSAEDMAKAYSELEKKIGQPQEKNDNSETVGEGQETIQNASVEFFEKGELSEDTYEALAKAGLSRELVDSYVAGQSALIQNEQDAIRNVAGNDYDKMSEWAGKNLSDDEMRAYNDAVTSGTIDQAKFAVSGLYARYKAENGNQPTLTMGNTAGSGSMPFSDMQDVRRAMSDPRYKAGDKAYHAEVDRRLAVSNL